MCEPLSVAMAVTAALSAIASYTSQKSAADAQEDYNDQMTKQQNNYMKANAEASNKAYFNDMQQEGLRMQQTAEASSEELQALQRDTLQAAGTAQASGANNAVMTDIFRNQARASGQIKTNLAWEQEQSKMNLKSMQANALNRIRAVRPYIPTPVNQPNRLGLVAGLGGAATTGFAHYRQTQSLKQGQTKATTPSPP